MGRYYNGDIEGKFWFAVQSSDDADFFGASGTEPTVANPNQYLDYHFTKDEHLKEKSKEFLEWYARLELGEQILDCVLKKGECSFESEL